MNAGIAIVGMACRYPDANTPEELWQMVLANRRAFRSLPQERLRLNDYAPRGGDDPDGIYPIEAALLENYAFDRNRFRVSGSAMQTADFSHWLSLDVATDALADSGLLDNDRLDRATAGVVVGNTLTGEFSRAGMVRLRFPYVRRQLDAALAAEGICSDRRATFLERFEDAFKAPFPPPNEETLAGALSNTIAGRICNHHDWHGGGFTVDGACASSLLAVANACRLLASGELDTVLAGGVDLSLDPFELVGFARNGALSRTVMRVFDARSDGFWPGEGCGFVVLMRGDDARRAGMRIRAVIRGWGMSTDGAGGLTRPTVAGQREAILRAWRQAGTSPGHVPLFEAHGTGTAVGDLVEIAAIADARAAEGITCPAVVGSIKGNIGHTKAAAGIAGLLKATLALKQQILPAATGCEQVHPDIAARADAVRVTMESRVWPKDWPLLAGVSAMGFGGINLHLALQGAAESRRSGFTGAERRQIVSSQDAELFLFSGGEQAGLRAQIASLSQMAPRLSRAELADAAAACCAKALASGSAPMRAMIVASTPAELAARLDLLLRRVDAGGTAIEPDQGIATATAGAPRIGLVFPGQAAPVRGDGGVWRRRFPALVAVYREADLPPAADPAATQRAQPAIIADCLAGLTVLRRIGIEASVAVGHSVGELAALHWGGAFDAEAALRLGRERGRAMAERSLTGGTMALIGAAPEKVERLLTGTQVRIACYNSTAEQVIAGDTAIVARIVDRAAREGLTARLLAVSHAFHSDYVAPAAEAVRELATTLPIARLVRRVISTVTGRTLAQDAYLPDLLGRQVTAPVRFAEAVTEFAAEADLAIEVGPGHGMARLVASQTTLPVVSLDVGGSSLSGLLTAAGTAFVMNARVDIAALFADRFVRDFDLNRPRRFLANPCETAPEATVPSRVAPAQAAEAPSVPALPVAATPLETLRAALARRLELNIAAIAPEHHLLGDLHLNSIAVGQIVVETAHALGRCPPTSVTNFATATVAQAASALAEAPLAADADPDLHPPGLASWLRCFATIWEERPVGPPEQPLPASWRVVGDPAHPLANQLPRGESCRADSVALLVSSAPTLDDLGWFLDAAAAVRAAEPGATLLVVGAAGAAFARCLSLEHPDTRIRVVDVPPDCGEPTRWIAAELASSAPRYSEARYDADGVRRVPVLRAVASQAAAETPPLGANDVVLVSGGARGIGAECALALATRTGARLALLGRSPAEAPEVAATLARLHAEQVIAQYESADVTDAAAVAAAVARLSRALGPVTMILHAAGVNQPTTLDRLDLALLRTTVMVKTVGLANLLAATDPDRLRLLLGFGSIIGRIGLAGEAHYALANDWLANAIAAFGRAHTECRALTLEWSVWSGVGMGEVLGAVEALGRAGVAALPVTEATSLFTALVSAPPPHPTLVVASRFGTPPTVDLGCPPPFAGRYLDRVRVFYPNIEVVADAALDPTADPYLADHTLARTPLFPAALGLEAMAQAAAALTGRAPSRLEEVMFLRPVSVRERGTLLRVAALCRSDGNVELVLRGGDDGLQTDHFRATAINVAESDRSVIRIATPASTVALDPSVVYEHLLFHTGRFRRIESYAELSATTCVARISPGVPLRWFPLRAADDLLLGDPAVRDAALHALQVCVPHRRVLPVSARRVQLGVLRPDRVYSVHGRERARGTDHFVFDVDIRDADGDLAERWEGLTLRAIENLPTSITWPAPLAAVYTERRLSELLPRGAVRVALSEGVDGAPPASDRLLAALLPPGDMPRRRPDGRPEAAYSVSAAHAGPLTLAVAGDTEIGCDLETLTERSEFIWCGLLGRERLDLAKLIAGEIRETLSEAATRVWTAAEALKKAGADVLHAPVVLDRVDGGWVVLSSSGFVVPTWVGHLERGTFALAIAARFGSARAVPLRARSSARAGRSAWSYRHVVGFGDTNLVGNVYFVNHLEWQGRCREMFLRDKAASVIADLANGLALVTVRCSCEYLAELTAFDEVRLDMRLDRIVGNRIAFRFDYWRCGGGADELVAVGEQEVACLRASGGAKLPTEIPAALLEALAPYGSDQPPDVEASVEFADPR